VEDSFIVGKKNKLHLTKSGGAQKHRELWTLKSGGSSLGAFTPMPSESAKVSYSPLASNADAL